FTACAAITLPVPSFAISQEQPDVAAVSDGRLYSGSLQRVIVGLCLKPAVIDRRYSEGVGAPAFCGKPCDRNTMDIVAFLVDMLCASVSMATSLLRNCGM